MTPVEKLNGAAPECRIRIGHIESTELTTEQDSQSGLETPDMFPPVIKSIKRDLDKFVYQMSSITTPDTIFTDLLGPTPPSLLFALQSPKVTYCHQLLPCCQSSSSNTLTLSAHWPCFLHHSHKLSLNTQSTADQRCTRNSHIYEFLTNGFLLDDIIQHTHSFVVRTVCRKRSRVAVCLSFYTLRLSREWDVQELMSVYVKPQPPGVVHPPSV